MIIVPTKYYKTPTDTFRDWKVSTVIWANHNVRAAITAMQNTTNTIFREQSLVNVEPHVSPFCLDSEFTSSLFRCAWSSLNLSKFNHLGFESEYLRKIERRRTLVILLLI